MPADFQPPGPPRPVPLHPLFSLGDAKAACRGSQNPYFLRLALNDVRTSKAKQTRFQRAKSTGATLTLWTHLFGMVEALEMGQAAQCVEKPSGGGGREIFSGLCSA
jgi:hypothetical protein